MNQTVDSQEQYELELAEKARVESGSWDAIAPGKADNFGQSFKRLIGLLAPFKAKLILVCCLGAISVVLAVIAPKILGEATNIIFEGAFLSDTGGDFQKLAETLSKVLAIYVVSAFLGWYQGFAINKIMMLTIYRLRKSVEDKIHKLPLSYFDKVQRGELLSRVTNDIDNITQTMQQSLSNVITSLLTVLGVLIMMFSISWQLTLITLISLPLTGVIFGIIGPKSQKHFGVQWRKMGRLNSRVEESFSGHGLVKVYGREQDTLDKFKEENEDLFQASFKAQFLSGLMMPAMIFVGNLTYVGIAVMGAKMVTTGSLRIGDVQAFIQYSQQFSQPLSELGGMAAVVQSGTASAERVFQLLDEPEQSPETNENPELAKENAGLVEFKNVAFSYSPDVELITDLSFKVAPGHTVAIVGHTGAGKTTLVNLLMRFYDLSAGAICIGDHDITSGTRQQVRGLSGMGLQDPWLFAGSIKENIRYGKPDASDEEVLSAAKATYVDRFVHSLPLGYETVLDEEASNVSAGERQLITIARAFVSDPAVLILDEATSSVDTRTELLLQKAMAALRQGRTSFVIAHRLSTIRDADLILVMEHGDIVEQGSHEELIKAQGAYWELYNSQFEQAIT